MHALQLGPLALSTTVFILAVCVIAAVIVGRRVAGDAHKTQMTDIAMTAVIVAAVVARIAFVLRYWPQYQSAPFSALDVRDGGFSGIGAVAGLAAYAAWIAWRRPLLRSALAASLTTAAIAFALLNGASSLLNPSQLTRPSVQLARTDGIPTTLDALAAAHPGQPMVVNLWATWCPPCRAELPMLVAAQRLHRDVVFVFVDEGEALATVRDYLKAQSLAPGNLLLDGNQRLAQATNTRGFPSTFFFAADGRLVAQHLGMLSPATLARALEQLAAATRPAARPSTQSGGNLVRRPPASSASAFRAMHPRSARVAGARDRT